MFSEEAFFAEAFFCRCKKSLGKIASRAKNPWEKVPSAKPFLLKPFFAVAKKALGKLLRVQKTLWEKQPNGKAFCLRKSLGKRAFGKAFCLRKSLGKRAFGRAQIATEYLIITVFLLAIITITFAYSFINYDQSIKITQANNAIDALINKADYVYSLGPENSQFVWITLPIGTTAIGVTNVCGDKTNLPCGEKSTGNEAGCDCKTPDRGGISFSAINLTIGLLGGPATISWPSKAKLELVDDAAGNDFPCTGTWQCDGTYKIRVCWNRNVAAGGSDLCSGCSNDKICLKKV